MSNRTPKNTPIEFGADVAANAVLRAFDFLRLVPSGIKAWEAAIGHVFDEFSYQLDDYVETWDSGWRKKYRKLDVGNNFSLHVTVNESKDIQGNIERFTCYVAFYFEKTFLSNATFYLDANGQNPCQTYGWNNNRSPMDKVQASQVWNNFESRLRTKIRATLNGHETYMSNPTFYDTMKAELRIQPRKKK